MAAGYVPGVDFGTSNTTAVLRGPDGAPRPLLVDGVPQLPSAVFVAGATRLAGRDALHHGLAQPAGLEPNPKRRIDDVEVLLSADELPVAELLLVVLVAGIIALNDDDPDDTAAGPTGSASPTPAATGPPGDLSIEKGSRQCRIGPVATTTCRSSRSCPARPRSAPGPVSSSTAPGSDQDSARGCDVAYTSRSRSTVTSV